MVPGRLTFALRSATAMLLALAFWSDASASGAHLRPNGLTAQQETQLRHLRFAVVPNPLPHGFRVVRVVANLAAKTYEVDYRRADGATIAISGSATSALVSAATPKPSSAPAKASGFFSRVKSAFSSFTSSSSSNGADSAHEEEAGMTQGEVIADSSLIGPIHFAQDGRCLHGESDPSKATIRNARFTVDACNLNPADPLTNAYRTVARP